MFEVSFGSGPAVTSPRSTYELRILKRGTSGADVRTALYETLKRDEVKIKEGKWRLVALVQQRRAS